ncbi:MAG TPA: ABC transporter substrate-binding protein [Streptosporangiaceae bacterium]|jgi:branched-chain amino acid transport system substrate-binding protein
MLRAALVTPLSGPLGRFGRAGAAALSLWAGWRGGGFPAGIELTVFDAHPDPVTALRTAERLAPDLLFGPYGSSTTAAVAGATSRLVWNHGGARVPGVGNLVSVLAPAGSYFRGAVRAVREVDPELPTLCVLSSDTGFSRAVAAGAVDEAGRLGLRAAEGRLPVAEGTPPAGVREAGMLLVAGPFGDEAAAARRLLPGRWRAAGFVGAGVDEVLAELGAGREGLLGPAQWLAEAAPPPDEGPSAGEFAAAYRHRTGTGPPYPAAQAFAAGVIAARCLREAGTADDAALMAAACALECTTMYGSFRLDPRSRQQVGHQVLTVQWQDGARRVIWPPEQAQAALRYPLA